MPEEILAIIIIAIASGTLLGLTSMILKHRQSSRSMSSGGSDQGVRTSELKQMMREAATEAVAPLEARIDEMQMLLEDQRETVRSLPPAREQELLEFDEMDESEGGRRVRRKARQD